MNLFGLACEGITDQTTIANILRGYFNISKNKIRYLQPFLDETDEKRGEGGWRILLEYLKSERFRDDVLNTQFLIVQIDTDIAKKEIGVNTDNLNIEEIVIAVKKCLKIKINEGETGFYDKHATKIIFAISVHSLECWLFAYYAQQTIINDCFEALKKIPIPKKIPITKKQRNYDQLSQPFLIRQHIDNVAEKDHSFRFFIQSLETSTLPTLY